MRGSGFTDRQRRIVLVMVLIIAAVFALLAGFIVTSWESFRQAVAAVTPSPAGTPQVAATHTPLPTPSPTPAATPMPEKGIWSQVRAARLFDQIAHQVETERALSPRAEVPLSFLGKEETASMLRQLYAERDLASELRPYAVLGLVPEQLTSIDVRVSAGIYVPEHEQLTVCTDEPEGDGNAQTLVAHAYIHALQDQHFDLEAVIARARTVDERLAAEALIAGDATLATALYRYGDPASADWTGLTELIVAAEQPRYSGELTARTSWPGSEAWRRLERFANWEGRMFVETLFERGGWDGVNRAYGDPPRSTEQVLHPSRYLEERDEPRHVVVPDVGSVLGEGWEKGLEETLGEFVIGLYLDQVLPKETSWQAAEGWDGDTLVVWEREGGRRVLIWRTVWDSSADAVAFAHSLATLTEQRHVPARPLSPPRGLEGQWWETGAGTVHVCRTARYVLFVQAPDVNTVVNVVSDLP
ncbi:MAG: hypothetical protein U9R72_12920 [Chloroflexota bacterium]|nr:hypothetical protein [Chloroflexota bacterium]